MRRLGYEGEPFLGSERSDATTHLLRFEGKLCAVVTVNPERILKATPAEAVGLLIHEAVHVWQEFCREIKESSPCDEFEAYSIQAIAQRLIVSFNEQLKHFSRSKRKTRAKRTP